jgi:carbonic anhydrase
MARAFDGSRRSFLAVALGCPICAAAAGAPAWNYSDEGPQKWSALDPSYGVCASGDQQSPVDLRDGVKADPPNVEFHWKREQFKALNTGRTVQFSGSTENSLIVGTEKAGLVQFHFHLPSEHALSGKRQSMEVHFVHQRRSGDLTVISALLAAGGSNSAFSTIMSNIPRKTGEGVMTTAPVDPTDLLPTSRQALWRYEGSLTTPPCSQTVEWIVFNTIVSVKGEDVERFRSVFPMNARPLQAIHRRFLLRS